MQLEYILYQYDYLKFYQFSIKTKEGLKNKQIKNRIFVLIFFLIFSLIFLNSNDKNLAIIFSVVSVFMFIFYPQINRWRQNNSLLDYVIETHKNNIGKKVAIKFNNEFIESKAEVGESKIYITQIEIIYETQEFFFIKVLTNEAFIIPKNRVNNASEVASYLQELSVRLNIKYNLFLNWK